MGDCASHVASAVNAVERFVYTLTAPGSAVVRYVGVTGNTYKRRKQHKKDARKAVRLGRPLRPVEAWVLGLRARGQRPVMRVVETVPGSLEAAEAREAAWIARLHEAGAPLLNVLTEARARA